MQKGYRSIFRLCACGCGGVVQPYIRPQTGRVAHYPKFIPGHGNRHRVAMLTERLRADPMSHPKALPIGTIRGPTRGQPYQEIKTGPRTWQYLHRHVMERHLGRTLDRSEHVHHIDENPLNNALTNLEVLTASEHQRRHRGEVPFGWTIHGACRMCGTAERPHYATGLCNRCYQRANDRRPRKGL